MVLVLILFSSVSPLLILLILIFLLFLVVLLLSIFLGDYLFSYLVFLLFMSGLIMMLMYFCSIVLSEKYLGITNIYMLLTLILVGIFNFDFYMYNFNNLLDSKKLVYFEFFNLIKYALGTYSVYSLFYISYLFVCLIVVYEIVGRCEGPLRMKI